MANRWHIDTFPSPWRPKVHPKHLRSWLIYLLCFFLSFSQAAALSRQDKNRRLSSFNHVTTSCKTCGIKRQRWSQQAGMMSCGSGWPLTGGHTDSTSSAQTRHFHEPPLEGGQGTKGTCSVTLLWSTLSWPGVKSSLVSNPDMSFSPCWFCSINVATFFSWCDKKKKRREKN